MASDYSKLKNAELEALLKERDLPATGKKAEMVARLVEHDKLQKTTPVGSAKVDTAAASTEAAATAIAGGGTATRAPNPVAVPNQAPAIDPSATAELTASKDGANAGEVPAGALAEASKEALADAKAEEPKNDDKKPFTAGLQLAPTDVDAELAKRKARAAKFGTVGANSESGVALGDADALKALERAKRFGGGAAADGGSGETAGLRRLDEALPERTARGRKRGAGEAAAGGDEFVDEGLRKTRGRGGFRGRGRGARRGGGGEGAARGGEKGQGWMSEADRAAADKRKARFAAA